MQNSLPARPSLEQLKKLAKDLVKGHGDKQPEVLAVIARHLPELKEKAADEISAYPFALHDAQSVIARQYGFASWSDLHTQVEKMNGSDGGPVPDLDVTAKLQTVLRARETRDYALFCSVMSEEMKAFVTKERFEATNERMDARFKASYQIIYMGAVNRIGRPVHFWRMRVKDWETDLLIRMVINPEGKISGLLYSDPFDTGMGIKR